MGQSAVATPTASRAEFLLELSGLVEATFRMNLDGITHEESLLQPSSGNCINWNVGHMVNIHQNILDLLGRPRVADKALLKRYDRGSAPLSDPKEAMRLEELFELWNKTVERANEGLRGITAEQLAVPMPNSPRNNPNETVGSLLTVLYFHQTYHVGCLAALRRLAGKPGALK